MKKAGLLAFSIFVFVLLFYHQTVGLNFGILGLIIWFLMHFATQNDKRGNYYRLLSMTVLIASASQIWYGNGWTFITLYLTLLIYGSYAQYRRLSLVLQPVVIAYNYLIFPVRFMMFKWLPGVGNSWLQKSLALVIIPGLILVAFLGIYMTGSEIFYDFFKVILNIKLTEIFWLSLLGLFLFFNFWLLYIPRPIVRLNSGLSYNYQSSESKPTWILNANLVRKSGEITMVLVNILLLTFIVTYNYEQFFVKQEISRLSNDTHLRVTTIIFSIVMAIGLILFYFRKDINFNGKTIRLKKLSYLWLILNGLLVLSAFLKNGEYVYHYGLTLKRIGVFVFLILCFVGMYFSYMKIANRKTNYFLINRMAWVFFITMIITNSINFNWIVTKYNLTFQKEPDYAYLYSLDFNNYILKKNENHIPVGYKPANKYIRWRSSEPEKLLSASLYNLVFKEALILDLPTEEDKKEVAETFTIPEDN